MDSKGDDLDFELKAPANGKFPLRRVDPTALLDMAALSSQATNPKILYTAFRKQNLQIRMKIGHKHIENEARSIYCYECGTNTFGSHFSRETNRGPITEQCKKRARNSIEFGSYLRSPQKRAPH